MNIDFLDDYWTKKNVYVNKHFLKINTFLTNEINAPCIAEDKIKTKYKGGKKWDLHVPSKKIAIEYKSIGIDNNSKKAKRNYGNRMDEALGIAFDVKAYDKEYKLGYVLVCATPAHLCQKPITVWANNYIKFFDRLIDNEVYDFFCILMTKGISNHSQISEKYSMENFIKEINEVPSIHMQGLEPFMV